MRILAFILVIFSLTNSIGYAQFSKSETERWTSAAKRVQIIRDGFGVPHIYGKTDADAVFGLMYAQCEDDFPRVERNYIEKLGRLAELKGESYLYQDLYTRLILDSAEAKKDYAASPSWLKSLLNAYADGINYYLYQNPSVKPSVLDRFQPWFPLMWTDGSIGAISTGYLTAEHLKKHYEGVDLAFNKSEAFKEIQTGSNGFAISGMRSASGNAMLYINPHVDFYFRPEVHMVSEESLNVYGAVTWGQFFIYQGFNEHNGWMHTSNDVDVSDLYEEQIVEKNGKEFYKYENELRPVITRPITVRYKIGVGKSERTFTARYTHHGPVMSHKNKNLVSVRSYNRSMNGLIQSWLRTKTKGYEDYKKVMNLRANTSNNTVYAAKNGIIAYWHGNHIPVRDKRFDWSKPIDGSVKETEWKGIHSLNEMVSVYNPPVGWIQNCNSSPFSVSGAFSPKRNEFPRYMAPDGENFRGVNAVRVLSALNKPTLEDLINAGYDRKLAAFEKLIPALVKAYDQNKNDPGYSNLSEVIDTLRVWDLNADASSVATHIAVEWGTLLLPLLSSIKAEDNYQYIDQPARMDKFLSQVSSKELLELLSRAVSGIIQNWGKWQVAWGEVNRFQRISREIELVHSDSLESIPVPYAASTWGMLPSYASRKFSGTKKRYGVHGNSFVAAVEFGRKIKAKSLLAGGQSGNENSPHFRDQANMYANGIFKDVLFYKKDVMKNAKKIYHPGVD